jgi:hypothetical protein
MYPLVMSDAEWECPGAEAPTSAAVRTTDPTFELTLCTGAAAEALAVVKYRFVPSGTSVVVPGEGDISM